MAVLGLVCLATISACTNTPGEAKPAPTTTANASTKASSTTLFPPRPKEIKIDRLDPCMVFSPDQRTQLGLDREPQRASEALDAKSEPSCAYRRTRSEPTYGYVLTPIPREGADVWLREKRNADVNKITVEGYGAAEVRLAGGEDRQGFCIVHVDVAEGQSLSTMFSSSSRGAFTGTQECAKAKEAAEMAMRSIVSAS